MKRAELNFAATLSAIVTRQAKRAGVASAPAAALAALTLASIREKYAGTCVYVSRPAQADTGHSAAAAAVLRASGKSAREIGLAWGVTAQRVYALLRQANKQGGADGAAAFQTPATATRKKRNGKN